MTGQRRKRTPVEVPADVRILLRPIVEGSEAFQKRTEQVQDLLVQMILIAKKTGRPKATEGNYEEAA
ncbi:MAG: hypothetical protein EOP06_01535 [Proteobacteria bacterium]|nr:MAG: hypothetical protein EOP06_01535 [Pseudomonadota bacterium]